MEERHALCRDHKLISPRDLARLDDLAVARMRINSFRAFSEGSSPPYSCVECRHGVWPRLSNNRREWVHHIGGPTCALKQTKRLSHNQLIALIHHGEQEGERHRKLVEFLARMAESDENIEKDSIRLGKYYKPWLDVPFGRYPDLYFRAYGKEFAVEAQLKAISLYCIVERSIFYTEHGVKLIWVTSDLDLETYRHSWQWDVIAEQSGAAYSVDSNWINDSQYNNGFRLIRQVYSTVDSSIFRDAVSIASFIDGEKELFIHQMKAAASTDYTNLMPLIPSLFDKLGISQETGNNYVKAKIISMLLAMRFKRVVGYNYVYFHEQVNKFLDSEKTYSLCAYIEDLLVRHRPDLLDDRVKKYIARAKSKVHPDRYNKMRSDQRLTRLADFIFN